MAVAVVEEVEANAAEDRLPIACPVVVLVLDGNTVFCGTELETTLVVEDV